MSKKNIIVAGAGGYVGWSLVKSLLEHEFNIFAVDIKFSNDQKQYALDFKNKLFFSEIDLVDEKSTKSIFKSIKNVDGIVNCSYPKGPRYGKNFYDISVDDLNENINLHLNSFFILTREAVNYFNKNKSNISIVNFASIYGTTPPKFNIYDQENFTMPVEYAFVKNSIINMSGYVSSLVQDSRLRINTVSPGGIYDNHSENFKKKYSANTRGKGMIDREDVIGAVKFLLSDDSKYISGQNIVIDDGFSL